MQQKAFSNPFKEKALETSNFVSELFNINYENLQEFLEKTVNVINAHAKTIASLEDQLKSRVTAAELENSLGKISESIKFPDNELYKSALSESPEKPLSEASGNKVEENTHKICNKLRLLTAALAISHRKNREFDSKLQKLEGDFAQKVSKAELKDKFSRSKKKLKASIEDQRAKLTRKIEDLEKKVAASLAQTEVSLKDVEKKTIWKIQDCETLLQKRINNEYVDTACKAMEERLRKEMKMLSEGNFSEVNKAISELKYKFQAFEASNADKFKGIKKLLTDLEENLPSKYAGIDAFQDLKRTISDKLNEYFLLIKDLEKRGDPFVLFKKLEESLLNLKDNHSELEKKHEKSAYDIEDLRINLARLFEKDTDSGKTAEKLPVGPYDPHKLCALESEQKKMKEDLHEYKHMVREFEKDLKSRLDLLDKKILGSLANLKQDDNKFANLKEEILSYFDKTQLNLNEKLKSQGKEIEELTRKLAPLADIEKKIKRLSQKLDLDTILKQLQGKADQQELLRECGILEEKIKGINDLFGILRKEFERLEGFYNEFSGLLQQNNQQETITTFIGNNSVTKSRCLCCGIKGKNINYSLYGLNHMHGTDGKVYRADLRNANLYEGQEVYDLSSNQIENILNKSANNLDNSRSFVNNPPAQSTNYTMQNTKQTNFLQTQPQTTLPLVKEGKTTDVPEKEPVIKRKNSKKPSKTGRTLLRPDSAKK